MQALHKFKTYFLRGLATLLPTILTVWIFVQLYLFIQHNVSSHINRGLVRVLVYASPYYPYITPDDLKSYVKTNYPAVDDNEQMIDEKIKDADVNRAARIEEAEIFWVHGGGQISGFVIAFIIVIFVGAFLASFIGKTLWRMFEKAFVKAPFIRMVYPHIKQVTDFFLTKQKLAFSRVVAVEYPRKGTWSIGMLTGTGLKKITEKEQKEFLTVFVPTSPTPFTGYVILFPKDEVVELDMTVEEAVRFVMSGGVISPTVFESYSQETKPVSLKKK